MIQTNKIYNIDCQEGFKQLNDNSIHLIVTSPPYNVNKEYEENQTFDDWYELMKEVIKESKRVLVSGGRLCINVANIARKPYIPLNYYIIDILLQIKFLLRGIIIWEKGISGGKSTTWGSWRSASNPVIRDDYEFIIVSCKDKYKLEPKGINSISSKDFLFCYNAVWHMNAESNPNINHPTPFPINLPKQLIEFYTFENNIILDPFIGSGTTAIAALLTRRKFIGFEKEKKYVDLANKRIYPYLGQQKITDFTSHQ